MKHILIHIAILISLNTMAGDSIRSQLYIGFGPAIPQKAFASMEFADTNSGFANTGTHFNMEYTYKINQHIGVCANYAWGRHQMREEFMNISLKEELINQRGFYPDGTYTFEHDKYKWNRLMFGVTGYLQEEKYTVFLSGMIGNVKLTVPEQTNQYSVYQRDVSMYRFETDENMLGSLISSGIQFRFGRNLSIRVNGDYFWADFKPTTRYIEVENSEQTVDKQVQLTRPFYNLTVSAGIIINFKKKAYRNQSKQKHNENEIN